MNTSRQVPKISTVRSRCFASQPDTRRAKSHSFTTREIARSSIAQSHLLSPVRLSFPSATPAPSPRPLPAPSRPCANIFQVRLLSLPPSSRSATPSQSFIYRPVPLAFARAPFDPPRSFLDDFTQVAFTSSIRFAPRAEKRRIRFTTCPSPLLAPLLPIYFDPSTASYSRHTLECAPPSILNASKMR